MNVDSCNIEVAKYICNVKYADWLKSLDTAEGQFANKEKYGIIPSLTVVKLKKVYQDSIYAA